MHNTRMKLVGSEEEENGITIVQLSQLMNCRKANGNEEKKSVEICEHFPMSSLELLWWTTFDKITICFEREGKRSDLTPRLQFSFTSI